MATCKDCMHHNLCFENGTLFIHFTAKGITDENVETNCPFKTFKNKADFVEVVRCPECIYCENMKCSELKDNSGHPLDVAIFDYCSQGVRK